MKHTLATCAFSANIYLLLGQIEARRLGARAEWHATQVEKPFLVEKAADIVENAVTSGWPDGEEGWWAAALERGGEPHGGMVALEHTAADGGALNGEECGFWRMETTGSRANTSVHSFVR